MKLRLYFLSPITLLHNTHIQSLGKNRSPNYVKVLVRMEIISMNAMQNIGKSSFLKSYVV